MVVHLSADLEKLVQAEMESGLYRSANEVIREALHALQERDRGLEARALAFQAEIGNRLAGGPATPMDFPGLKAKIQSELAARKQDRP